MRVLKRATPTVTNAAVASQAEGLVFESQQRQTYVVKAGSASSKSSTIGVSVTGL